jgi:hypothetical protein
MLDNGGNVAPPAITFAYTIENHGNGPQVVWHPEAVSVTVEQALQSQASPRRVSLHVSPRRECDDWLRAVLSTGPVLRAEVITKGHEAGFKLDAIRRAKARVGVTSTREGFGAGARFYWRAKGTCLREHADTVMACRSAR